MQTMTENQVNQDAVDFVKYGYGDSHGLKTRSLDFRTETFANYETFAAALAMVPGYNNFDGPAVAKRFKSLWPELMSVKFGREGSPVLYVQVPYWSNQVYAKTMCVAPVMLTDQERANLAALVQSAGNALEADENSYDAQAGTVRLWWD
jgi:hypothetical protein